MRGRELGSGDRGLRRVVGVGSWSVKGFLSSSFDALYVLVGPCVRMCVRFAPPCSLCVCIAPKCLLRENDVRSAPALTTGLLLTSTLFCVHVRS